jgi:hypothetical protein
MTPPSGGLLIENVVNPLYQYTPFFTRVIFDNTVDEEGMKGVLIALNQCISQRVNEHKEEGLNVITPFLLTRFDLPTENKRMVEATWLARSST